MLASGQPPSAAGLGWGLGGGVLGAVGALIYYRPLAIGPPSLVAPVAATAAAVPTLVGLAQGQVPGGPLLVGLALALGGVLIIAVAGEAARPTAAPVPARPPHLEPWRLPALGPPPLSVVLALTAALCFGVFFFILERASDAAGDGQL